MVARLLGDISSFEASMSRAQGIMVTTAGAAASMGKQVEQAGLNWDRIGKYSTAAAAVVAAASTQMASTFESSMERLHTQAGVPQEAIKGLGDGVLDLAGKVGTAPNS